VRRIASISFCALPSADRLGNRYEMRFLVEHALDPRALRALDQHLHRAVGQLQHLQDRRDAAHAVHVVG